MLRQYPDITRTIDDGLGVATAAAAAEAAEAASKEQQQAEGAQNGTPPAVPPQSGHPLTPQLAVPVQAASMTRHA